MYLLMIQNSYNDNDMLVRPYATLKEAKEEAEGSFDIVADGMIATIFTQDKFGKVIQVLQANHYRNEEDDNLPVIWKK